jgi:hypothetical protein
MKETEEELQAVRESMLKSLGVLAVDPAEDLNPSEARWVAAFREYHADRTIDLRNN